jgi:DNA-binding PadR family transcriptional regulator
MHPFSFKSKSRHLHPHGHGGRHGGDGHFQAGVADIRADLDWRGGHRGRGDSGGGGGGGGRRGRMFDAGDLKLLVLKILQQAPSHGYEVIKAIGDRVGGDYSPSPGTIYPTLTLLEDLGLIKATTPDSPRKQYALTPDGEAHLAEQAEVLQRIEARLTHTRDQARARCVPDIQRAMENLKTALRLRFEGDTPPDAEALRQIAETIDRAAVEIGRR